MSSTVLINEFLPNPVGADKGWEWIEIVNVSENEIDISNWEIQVAGIRFSRAFKFPFESKILPNQYLLICEEFVENCHFYTTQLAIQNGGKETDGVRILNSNLEVIDTVLYDTTNSNNLLNDFGEIEKDENIVEMPAEGCSLSRKSFTDTNFSIQDFLVTCNPTPRKENFFLSNMIISEVGFNFIEFYSTNIPPDLEKWYFKESESSLEKVFLKNNFKNNFFFLETTKPFKNIYLYSSENLLADSFSENRVSKNYTLCRLNSKIEESFSFCQETKGEKNESIDWKYVNILEIIQINKEDSYIVNPCVMYKFEEFFVISDETAALAIQCEQCQLSSCFVAELNAFSNLEILQEDSFRNIAVENVTKGNYMLLFNKIVFLEAEFLKNDTSFSFFSTDIGIVKTKAGEYSEKVNYTLKGILQKDEDLVLKLEYPVILKQQQKETLPTLEQTGDPLIFLLFFFIIPFLLSKIFVKLSTIKLKNLIK